MVKDKRLLGSAKVVFIVGGSSSSVRSTSQGKQIQTRNKMYIQSTTPHPHATMIIYIRQEMTSLYGYDVPF